MIGRSYKVPVYNMAGGHVIRNVKDLQSFCISLPHIGYIGGKHLQRYVLNIFIHILCKLSVIYVVLSLICQSYIGTRYTCGV